MMFRPSFTGVCSVLSLSFFLHGCVQTVALSGADGGDANAAMEASPSPDVQSPPDTAMTSDVVVDAVVPDAVVDVPVRDVATDTAMPMLAKIPSRPAMPTALPDALPRVFVVRRFNFGFESPTLWGIHGFDRDNIHTVDGRQPAQQSCRPRGASSAPADGVEGRDNSFGATIGTLLAGSGWTESASNDGIAQGNASLALRVYATNGRTMIDWLPVVQGHRPGNRMQPPAFDGTDVWHVDAGNGYQSGTTTPRIRAEGYITGTTLVAPLPNGSELAFSGSRNPFVVRLSGGFAVGSFEGNILRTTEFSGLWPLTDALTGVGYLGICPQDPILYQFAYGEIQKAADLLTTQMSMPSVDCDAISFAFGMDFVPATLGEDVMGAARTNPCP